MLSPVGRELLERIRRLNVDRSGGQRKPHKPLLLLLALAELRRGRPSVSLEEIEERMTELLEAYAPPAKRPNPALPYWYLRSDGLWEVVGAEELEVSRGGFPRLPGLRQSIGHLPERFIAALSSDPVLLAEAAQAILDDHFRETLHEQVLADVGLTLETAALGRSVARRARDSSLRPRVLEAYEHRCAATGFRAALGRTYFGVDAAHVMSHCSTTSGSPRAARRF